MKVGVCAQAWKGSPPRTPTKPLDACHLAGCDLTLLHRTHLGIVMEYVAGGNMADYILKTILLKFGSFDTRDGLVMEEDEARYFFTQVGLFACNCFLSFWHTGQCCFYAAALMFCRSPAIMYLAILHTILAHADIGTLVTPMHTAGGKPILALLSIVGLLPSVCRSPMQWSAAMSAYVYEESAAVESTWLSLPQ